MSDPANKRNNRISNLVLLLLIIALIFVLYNLTGGNLFSLFKPGTYSGGGDPISQLVGSLRGFGQGLRNAFSGLIH